MTDEAAFLAAIAAAPDDDAPRLVFADWLDEYGQPDRAAWLRDPDIRPFMGIGCENPIPRLIDALRGEIQPTAHQALVRIGPPAVPALLAALRSSSGPDRMAVCGVLVDLAADLAPFRPQLEAEAASPDPVVRDAALAALGCMSFDSGLGPLVERLDSPDPATWAAALQGIVNLDVIGSPAVPAVLRRWRREAAAGTGTAFRQAALAHLGILSLYATPETQSESLALLVGALAHPVLGPLVPDAVRLFADTAVPPLRAALNTLDPTGARLAIQSLYRVALDPDALVAEALTDARTPDRARRALLEAVADGVDYNPDQLAPAVAAQLDHPDRTVRRAAVAALGMVDPAAALRVSRDLDLDVRCAVARVAGSIARRDSDDADRARAVRRRALADSDPTVRVVAWGTYALPDDFPTLVRDLRALTHHDDPDVRRHAPEVWARVLDQDGPRREGRILLHRRLEYLSDDRVKAARDAAIDMLLDGLRDRSRPVRTAAATALAQSLPQGTEAAAEPLVEAMRDPDPAIREQAALAFSRLEWRSEPAVRAALRLLRDEDAGVVAAGLQALGVMRQERPDLDRQMRPFLRDRSARVRAAAGRALATWDGPAADVLDDALDLVAEKNDAVRAAGVRLLAKLGPEVVGDRLVGHLRRAVRDPAPAVRAEGVDAFQGRPDEFARPHLSDFVKALAGETDAAVAEELVTLIRSKCPDRVGELARLLDDPSTTVRARALEALAGAGPALAAVVPRIATEIDRGHPDTLLPAIWALRNVGPAGVPAVSALTGRLDEDGSPVQEAAVQVVGTLETAAEPLLARVERMWRDPMEYPRGFALRAYARLAGWLPAAEPGVRDALRDRDPRLVQCALVGIGDSAARGGALAADVVPLLTHPDADVRQQAAVALEAIGPGAGGAVPGLLSALDRETEWYPREKLVRALGAIGPAAAAAVPTLARIIGGRETESHLAQGRRAATEALGKIKSGDAVPALRAALTDPVGTIREAAAEALVALGPAALPALPDVCRLVLDRKWDTIRDMLTDAGYDRRMCLLDAIEAMKTTADPVLPTLQKMLDDPNGKLRERTAEVLVTLGPDAHPILRRALKHRDEGVRENARRVVGG